MLFKLRDLERIADGTLTLAFRRWKRGAVRPGSRLRTAVGIVAIDTVEEITEAQVTAQDLRSAGYASPDDLWKDLARHADGQLYRIGLRMAGPDPRVALRERSDLDAEQTAEIQRRLAGIDKAARRGPWTHDLLRLIHELPATAAAELAERLGRDTQALKRDVRKLKELGLTESLDVGYRLSARGEAVVRGWAKRAADDVPDSTA
ncbi:HTH domain-containing protein [Nonomuraea sp. NPDC049758]|uniref:HVO_A0114 family putative DNA-binding protein n=1 Tax=Nonomuraea sp. NPDC049758 TaxID=3154360 RepID=UPI00344A0E42